MDVAGPIYMPLFNDLQSPLSNAPLSPLLPFDKYFDRHFDRHPDRYLDKYFGGHFNRHSDEYFDGDMDYLDNELDSDAIKAY
jgi:hypothetical protein